MWYSSKNRTENKNFSENDDRSDQYATDFEKNSHVMGAKNNFPNKGKFLLTNRSVTYFVLAALLLVTAGVTARQLLIKHDEKVYESFRSQKLTNAKEGNESKTANIIIAQDTSKDILSSDNLAKYSISLVLLHVEEWKNFWSSKNIRGFMSFYHDEFPDKKNFEDNKKRIFSKEQFIKIDISDVESETISNNIVVRFTQQYSSKSFSDTARKELVWQKTADGWKIITETIIK